MHPLHAWLNETKTERQNQIKLLFAPSDSGLRNFTDLVLAPHHWGVFASIGPNFSYAIFGRDSIETAEDVLALYPELAHDIIIALCRLQGRKVDYQSEEEPGKIHHEFRCKRFNGHVVPEASQHILYDLQHVWGGIGTDEAIYYGTYDATPLFIRLVGSYVDSYGPSILDEKLTDRHSGECTVRDCVLAALHWLTGKLNEHPKRLLAYKRINPVGILNQDWKDSVTSHLHIDGSLPNFNEPVVSVELQGHAYDALLAGIRLGVGDVEDNQHWQYLATKVQRNTVSMLWMEDRKYFAQGYDIGPDAHPRLLKTITSDGAALLDSSLIHDLPEDKARPIVDGIIQTIFADDMLTEVGVRCRSTHTWDLIDYIDYHGPNAVWPKETFDIAKGLRRAGCDKEAKDLEDRIQASLARAGEFSEFFYVSRNGTVWYNSEEALAHFSAESHGHSIPTPEPGQAWTIAAAMRIAALRRQEAGGTTAGPSRHPIQTTSYAYNNQHMPGSLN